MNDIQRVMNEIVEATNRCAATIKTLRESLKSPDIEVGTAMKMIDDLESELRSVRCKIEGHDIRDSIQDGSPDDSTSLGL